MSDTVIIEGLRLVVRIGFHEAEKHSPQVVKVDLAMKTDFRAGPSWDKHQGLVDYDRMTQHLIHHVEGRAYDLIEALAEDLAGQVFVQAPQVAEARVRVTKHPLAMPHVDGVAVELVRTPQTAIGRAP